MSVCVCLYVCVFLYVYIHKLIVYNDRMSVSRREVVSLDSLQAV